MKFNFKYKGKNFNIDVEKCENYFSRASGLMFRKKSKPLLFIFNGKTKQAIHSFFCVPFIAVWFDGEKIVDAKFVKPWRFSVKPKEKFDKLLEIPVNDENFNAIRLLIIK